MSRAGTRMLDTGKVSVLGWGRQGPVPSVCPSVRPWKCLARFTPEHGDVQSRRLSGRSGPQGSEFWFRGT